MLNYQYPEPNLDVGVSKTQLNFLVAMYVGAFTRAPEHEGLKYWGTFLSKELAKQPTERDAFNALSKQMYSDGKGNGEGGTTLNDQDYVNFAYNNILGRNGDSGGIQYWNKQLSTGAIDRGSFVSSFVNDALQNAGDGDFLAARVSVAKFLAQEKVSGSSAPSIDLSGSISKIYDVDSAIKAIESINLKYGAPDINQGGGQGGGQINQGVMEFSKDPLLQAQTWNMDFGGYRKFEINQFDVKTDKLFFGSLLSDFDYTGEPNTYADLSSYFTQKVGQAAFVRQTSELLVDLNGDGRYVEGQDMSVKLVGVFQLEDFNFTV